MGHRSRSGSPAALLNAVEHSEQAITNTVQAYRYGIRRPDKLTRIVRLSNRLDDRVSRYYRRNRAARRLAIRRYWVSPTGVFDAEYNGD